MPKRRSLVGTAHEAMGSTPKAQPGPAKKAPKKARHAVAKAPKEVARDVVPPAEPTPAPPEREHAATPIPANPYEALMGLASAAMRQNLETGARLARCKTPMEVLAAQTAHATALTQSFIAASLRMMQLSLSGVRWRR
ncbi:MAG TPA: phasin family protein [Stellaceae bacterium]|nr:phasin family protein [Stellaceae bacterium]